MSYPVSKAIAFPQDFLPGNGDNFLSNEFYVDSSTAEEVWPFLVDAALWPTYYKKISKVEVKEQEGTKLNVGTKFSYKDANLKIGVDCECLESQPPSVDKEGRLMWKASYEVKGEKKYESVRGWILENMGNGRTRIFTQEVQKGDVARKLYKETYDMLSSSEKWVRQLAEKGTKNKNGLLNMII